MRNYRLNSQLLRVSLALVVTVSAPLATAFRPLSEAEIDFEEVRLPPPVPPVTDWGVLLTRLPYLGYYVEYQSGFAAIKDKVDQQRTAILTAPVNAGAVATPNANANAASLAASTTMVGSSIASNLAGGWTLGTSANTTSTVLAGVSIAFDVLEWLSKDTSGEKAHTNAIRALNNPSLFLVREATDLADANAVHNDIIAGQAEIARFGLQCEPGRWHDNKPMSSGYFRAGQVRVRTFVCGFAPDDELGFLGRVKEPREYEVLTLGPARTLVSMRFQQLERMEHIPRLLGLDSGDKNAARVMYQKIAPTLAAKWTAVFTAPGSDGEWHAYAAREGYLAEFPVTPKR